jgi:hypothetical protein
MDERHQVFFTFVVLTVMFAAVGTFWVTSDRASGQIGTPSNSACNGALNGNPEGTLNKLTVPMGGTAASPAPIAPGTTVHVTITWAPTDWTSLNQLFDCVFVNGTLIGAYEEKPPINDGLATHTYDIPADAAAGTVICDRARLSGTPTGGVTTQKSNTVCFTVTGSPPSTTPPSTVPPPSSIPETTSTVPTVTTLVSPPSTVPTVTTLPPPPTTVPTVTTLVSPPSTIPSVTTTPTPSTVPQVTSTTTRSGTTTTTDPSTRTGGGSSTGGRTDVLAAPPSVSTGTPFARTGTDSVQLLALGLLVLNLGAMLVVAGRTKVPAEG